MQYHFESEKWDHRGRDVLKVAIIGFPDCHHCRESLSPPRRRGDRQSLCTMAAQFHLTPLASFPAGRLPQDLHLPYCTNLVHCWGPKQWPLASLLLTLCLSAWKGKLNTSSWHHHVIMLLGWKSSYFSCPYITVPGSCCLWYGTRLPHCFCVFAFLLKHLSAS